MDSASNQQKRCQGSFLILGATRRADHGGIVLKSSEDVSLMAPVAVGVVLVGFVVSVVSTRVAGKRILPQAREAERKHDPDKLPEQ